MDRVPYDRARGWGYTPGGASTGSVTTAGISSFASIGDHDWCEEGADYLLRAQRKDGSWPGARKSEGALLNTCFALLFLRRATVPVKVPRAITPEPSEGD